MVGALRPFAGAHANNVLGMNGFNFAHGIVAAPTGLQTGKIVSTFVCLFEYGRRNFDHR
jgi:hypothetical protein